MAESKSIKEKIQLWFSKENIPLKVVEDVNKIRLDALIAFKAVVPVGSIEKFEDVKTTDGLLLTIEPAIEKGAACVSLVNGVAEPIPLGEYTLEDGRDIIVMEPGIIDSVVEKQPNNPDGTPAVDDVVLAETNAKVTRLIEQVSKITEFSAAQTKTIAALELKCSALEKNQNTLVEGLNTFKTDTKEMLEEVFSEEATPPAVKPKNPLAKEPKKNIFH